VIKRTIEVSSKPAYLSTKLDQLLIRRDGEVVSSIPCEDIGVLVVDQPQTTYSHGALAALARSQAILVVCGANHLPAAILLPMADHSEVVWRVKEQLAVRKPLRKRLWRQLIRAKIRAQAIMLPEESSARLKLLALSRLVRSGDPNNMEAQAARVYWANWLPEGTFKRDADLSDLNMFLNYGYAILRAAMARALVAAGLLLALGLVHSNRSNAFCLADDLMEPLRPLVDRRVRELHADSRHELDRHEKAFLLEILTEQVRLGKEKGPLMVSLHRMVASLVGCFQGRVKQLEIPRPCFSADTDVCG
jgi:CRISP-associated protein Cas1